MSEAAEKKALRRRMAMRREQLSTADILRRSKALCARLLGLPEVAGAPMLAIYLACDGEIDVYNIYLNRKQEDKSVILPRFNPAAGHYEMVEVRDLDADTSTGFYGIREPLSTLHPFPRTRQYDETVTWLIPAMAFDEYGHRLGRGGGYYDRLLSQAKGCKIGVGYDWQIVEHVPATPRDVDMHLVVTDTRMMRCGKAA